MKIVDQNIVNQNIVNQNDELEFTALMTSRLCHDIISPVSAIMNGLEILEEEKDEEIIAEIHQMITQSVQRTIALLQICRLALGASGGPNAYIKIQNAKDVLRNFLNEKNTKIQWITSKEEYPRDHIKLILILTLIIADGIKNNGEIKITEKQNSHEITAYAEKIKIPDVFNIWEKSDDETQNISSKNVIAAYAQKIAHKNYMKLNMENNENTITIIINKQ